MLKVIVADNNDLDQIPRASSNLFRSSILIHVAQLHRQVQAVNVLVEVRMNVSSILSVMLNLPPKHKLAGISLVNLLIQL